MSGTGTDPKEIHIELAFPNGALVLAHSHISVVLSNDGVNPGFTVQALLNGNHVEAYILDDDEEEE